MEYDISSSSNSNDRLARQKEWRLTSDCESDTCAASSDARLVTTAAKQASQTHHHQYAVMAVETEGHGARERIVATQTKRVWCRCANVPLSSTSFSLRAITSCSCADVAAFSSATCKEMKEEGGEWVSLSSEPE
jgi:hypothetical protein